MNDHYVTISNFKQLPLEQQCPGHLQYKQHRWHASDSCAWKINLRMSMVERNKVNVRRQNGTHFNS